MTFRAPLLAILSAPDYRPVNDAALFRELKLPKNLRARFLHELRLLLSKGEVVQIKGDCYSLPPRERRAPARPEAAPEGRPIFKVQPKPAKAGTKISPVGRPLADAPNPASAPAPRPPLPSPSSLAEGELVGRINFRAGGSAWFIPSLADDAEPDAARPDSIQIGPGDTLNALPGDTVAVEIDAALRGKRFAPGDARNDEARGRVVRIVTRARTEIVGRLARVRTQYVVLADDPRFPLEVFVADPALSRLKPAPKLDDKVVATLEPWDDFRKPLRGVVTERL
ncbi:MAG: hypothetical protein H7067_14070 [Burkholderiales bacterium]|nr:hypothetical protein [Opitutaceae bacterium]